MKVRYSYLPQKFKGCLDEGHPILAGMRDLMTSGDFTLGKSVKEFEQKFADLVGAKYAIGVANGTDALRISLRAVGVRPGDEVITAANTFVASAGCADELFAVPRFVDIGDDYVIDADLLERAITPRTKAIVPVGFSGQMPDMPKIMEIANRHGIPVVEDACQTVLAELDGKCAGTWGACGAFSLHPLKNLNVWGDGGMITTNDKGLYDWIQKYRNHGMRDRDNIDYFGCNSRLDSLQAIVGNYLINETRVTVGQRRSNAEYYDKHLSQIEGVFLPVRRGLPCFHLYMLQTDEGVRDALYNFLIAADIEAKIHYPVPLQRALEVCGHSRSEFPNAYRISDRIISLPVDEHISRAEQDYCISKIKEFFSGRN